MTAASIVERFAELGHAIAVEEVVARIDVLTKQFKVPLDDAENSVISYFLRQNGVERADYYEGSGGNRNVKIADIEVEEGIWCNLRAKFTDNWDSSSEHIDQIGLIGDDTGKIKFVMWRNAGLSPMVIGKSYTIDNVVTSVYNDKVSVTMNKTSMITEIGDVIEVGYATAEYTGVLVQIKDGSGLINRCPECNRALRSGTCPEHGNVDGIYDLRIMGILDDGTSTQDVILNLEMTERIWGHSLSDATALAMDALDANVVIEDMRRSLVGKYYMVSGGAMDTAIIVNVCKVI